MKIKSFLFVLIFALTPAMWPQDKPGQAPGGPGSGNEMRAEHRQQMMQMHKQEMEAVRADIEKMKSSLAQMKANLLTIKDTNELSRWRDNMDYSRETTSSQVGGFSPGMSGTLLSTRCRCCWGSEHTISTSTALAWARVATPIQASRVI